MKKTQNTCDTHKHENKNKYENTCPKKLKNNNLMKKETNKWKWEMIWKKTKKT